MSFQTNKSVQVEDHLIDCLLQKGRIKIKYSQG